ncbi:ankyrin repeat-containing domain protein [Cladorrhinum sp. PSN259]|nr:ankyrin repeat-containing domain protein [Cladorrhinum sp. PSN259]
MADNYYTYNPIDLSTDAIRLLRLLRGSGADPIKCEVFEALLHQIEGVPYEALSYTWGDADSELFEIEIDGKKAMVRRNLYSALGGLRQCDQERVIWIDAICIDQGNHRERGHQVGQMREIYQMAEQVIVWLGECTDDIELLMHMMNKLDQRAVKRPDYRRRSLEVWEKEWPDLLRNPWFQRVWILQEVFNAKKAIIQCGRMTVPSRAFVVMPTLMEIDTSRHVQAVLDIMPGCLRIRENSWWHKRPDLAELLKRFPESEASDPRDKIYALLGISSPSDASPSHVLRPNYELSLQQTIRYTVWYLIGGPQLSETPPELPNWGFNQLHVLLNLDQLPQAILEWALIHDFESIATLVVSMSEINIDSVLPGLGSSPIMFLAKDKQKTHHFMSIIQCILSRSGAQIKEDSSEDRPSIALNLAVRSGNIIMAKMLLNRRYINPNLKVASYGMYETPLKFVWRQYIDRPDDETSGSLLKLLLSHHKIRPFQFVDPEDGDETVLLSPLYMAAKVGFRDVAERLLLRGDHIDGDSETIGESAFDAALREGHMDVVSLLLDWGRSLEMLEPWLFTASSRGHVDVVRALIDRGVNIQVKYRNDYEYRGYVKDAVGGETPLYAASAHGHTDVMGVLIDRGANVEATNGNRGVTALYGASQTGQLKAVWLLLDRGSKINTLPAAYTTEGKLTALYLTAREGHRGIKLLGVDGQVPTDKGEVLWIAAASGRTELVRALLVEMAPGPAELEHRDTDSNATPLWVASKAGHGDIVRLLLNAGADASTRAIHVYRGFWRHKWIRARIHADAQTTLSALWVACYNMHTEIARMLIQAGADVNESLGDGMSILCFCCSWGGYEIVPMLLEAGADVDSKDDKGRTALLLAAEEGLVTVVNQLIAKGATLTANEGWPPRCEGDSGRTVQQIIEAIAIGKARHAHH